MESKALTVDDILMQIAKEKGFGILAKLGNGYHNYLPDGTPDYRGPELEADGVICCGFGDENYDTVIKTFKDELDYFRREGYRYVAIRGETADLSYKGSLVDGRSCPGSRTWFEMDAMKAIRPVE